MPPTAATVFQMPSDSRECPVSPPSGNAVAIFPFAGSATGFFPVRYGIPVPPIASGEYGKNRTKTAMIFSGWQHGSSLPFVRCSALPSVCASPAYLPSSTWHYWWVSMPHYCPSATLRWCHVVCTKLRCQEARYSEGQPHGGQALSARCFWVRYGKSVFPG